MPTKEVWFIELDLETANRYIDGCAYVLSIPEYPNYVKIGDCQGNLKRRLGQIKAGLQRGGWANEIEVVAAWKFPRRGQALDVVNETRRIASQQQNPVWLEIERTHRKPDFLYREGLRPKTVASWMEKAINNLALKARQIEV
ncbi:MAG: hypothetical protein EA417_07395 [Gammaproteobacteria bacterium]|nr:MAG: hypothetical protein EA417_07395 [Gammaproteobacteria bacterium]